MECIGNNTLNRNSFQIQLLDRYIECMNWGTQFGLFVKHATNTVKNELKGIFYTEFAGIIKFSFLILDQWKRISQKYYKSSFMLF